jgi:hypothetical protein
LMHNIINHIIKLFDGRSAIIFCVYVKIINSAAVITTTFNSTISREPL